MKLVYYQDPKGNFGDDLNPWLWERLLPGRLDDDPSELLVGMGTILEPWFAEIVDWHGMSGRCAAIRTPDEGFRSIDDVQHEKEQVLIDLALGTMKNDGADVVILAGAPLAGLANTIRDRVPVPLVDGIQAAVTMAEGLVRLNPRKATEPDSAVSAATWRSPMLSSYVTVARLSLAKAGSRTSTCNCAR